MDVLGDMETRGAGQLFMNEVTHTHTSTPTGDSPFAMAPTTTTKTTTTATPPATPSVIDFTETFHSDASRRIFVVGDRAPTLEWSFNRSVVPLQLGWRARSDHNSQYESVISSTPLSPLSPLSDSRVRFSGLDTTFLYDVTGYGATLNLSALSPGSSSGGQIAGRDPLSQGSWLGQEMVIRLDWSIGEEKGSSQSGIFSVVQSYGLKPSLQLQMETWLQETNATDGSQIIGSGDATKTGAGPNGTPGAEGTPSGQGSGGSSGGGLSAGAIAGIAVGGGIAFILIVAGLVWFLLRRRRQNKQEAAYAPKQKPSNAFMEDKDMHVQHAVDSPRSPNSEDGQAPHIGAAPVSSHGHGGTEHGVTDDAGHTPYQPSTAGTRGDVPGTADHDGSRTETPQGVSRAVAHLVEEGMTADEIRHLEEEERQLDAEIERAGRH